MKLNFNIFLTQLLSQTAGIDAMTYNQQFLKSW